MKPDLKVMSLQSSRGLAQQVAQQLETPLEILQEEIFADGEIEIQCQGAVRGLDCLIVHSLARDELFNPNENMFRLFMMSHLLKDLGAHSLTVVAPYLCYSRSDERRQAGTPLGLKYMAELLETSGIDRILTLDVHNVAAFQNAFHCEAINLESAQSFSDFIKAESLHRHRPLVLSPDFGGIKRAHQFRLKLQNKLEQEVEFAYMEKFRSKEGLSGEILVGDVQGASVFLYDDMISTGKTILRAADKCRKAGALEIFVFATHGLLVLHPEELLYSPWVDRIFVTDTNPHLLETDFSGYPKLKVLPCAPILASALRALFTFEPIEKANAEVNWGEEIADFI